MEQITTPDNATQLRTLTDEELAALLAQPGTEVAIITDDAGEAASETEAPTIH